MFKIKLLIILFSISVLNFFSQIKKGDEFVSKFQYVKAISKYKKSIGKDSDKNQEANLKLADCYKKINDYENAELAYKNALAINSSVPPEVFYNYGHVLKINNKYNEAAEQYNRYIKLKPKDKEAANALKYCKEIKYYMSKPVEYEVKNIEKINTEKSEFSPIFFNKKLAFVAEKESFNFVDYNVNDYDGQPYLNMYVTEIEGAEAKKSKTLSKGINSEFHDGPGCISEDGKTLYFTRVTNFVKKDFTNRAKILIATGKERNWSNVTQFEYNSDNYSVAHPSISKDNNMLFFTSDMPGGRGGKDIWMCTKTDKGWGKPVNLGPDINTTGDEMFPTIRQDGILYFSSTGLPGYGGLDIYTAKNIDEAWILVRNEGLNMNSRFDDFGTTFLNDSIGYFSSNREGGKGKDDIYWFKFRSKAMSVSGYVLLTENFNDPAKEVEVVMVDDKGQRVDSMKTNKSGFFEFKNFDPDKSYMAVIDPDDPQLKAKARYFLADKNKIIQRISGKNGDQKFVFKNLPLDPNSLPDLYVDDNLTLAGNLMYGEKGSQPVKNTKLKLVNDYGDVLEETTTNEFGAFAFRNIPADQNYLISFEEGDVTLPPNTKITLTNKSGKELKTFYTGDKKFSFKVLSADKNLLKEMDVEDVTLSMNVYGYMYDQDKKPISSVRVKIKEEGSDAEPQEVTTGENGKFNFKNLKGDKNYLFETAENDPVLSSVKRIYIADAKGRIYKVLDKTGQGKFTFRLLEADKLAMGEFVVDDPWLQVLQKKDDNQNNQTNQNIQNEPLTIIENIYYAKGDYKFDDAGQKILDKVSNVLKTNTQLRIELSSHTDSRASDAFNLVLSKKRAQYAVDYILGKGVEKKRLKAVGYGETKLLNKCANDVECSDEEHGLNRRTEFKITELQKS